MTGFSCLGLKIPHLIILVLVDGLLDEFVGGWIWSHPYL